VSVNPTLMRALLKLLMFLDVRGGNAMNAEAAFAQREHTA